MKHLLMNILGSAIKWGDLICGLGRKDADLVISRENIPDISINIDRYTLFLWPPKMMEL